MGVTNTMVPNLLYDLTSHTHTHVSTDHSIVPRFSKKSLPGRKYPASRTIGGSRKRKKASALRVGGAEWRTP